MPLEKQPKIPTSQALATHMGDTDAVPGSWLLPGKLATAVIRGVRQQMKDLSLTLPFKNFEIKIKTKAGSMIQSRVKLIF